MTCGRLSPGRDPERREKRGMKKAWVIMSLLLVSAKPGLAELVPEEFYLERHAAHDVRFRADANLSIYEGGIKSAVYDLAGSTNSPLWYSGSIMSPYSERRAMEQTHAISAATPGQRFRASLTLGANANALYNRVAEISSDRGGPPEAYSHFYLRDRTSVNRHLRLRSIGALNLQAVVGDYRITLSVAGSLIQHWGYSYSSLTENARDILHTIREYEPTDLSTGWSAGALAAGNFEVGYGVFRTVAGVRHSRRSEDLPLRADIPLPRWDTDGVPLCFVGSRGTELSTWLWAGWHTARRYDSWEDRLLYRGDIVAGFTLAEGLVRVGNVERDSLEVRYYPHFPDDSTGFRRRRGKTRLRDSYTTVVPELYVTQLFSLSAPTGIWAFDKDAPWESHSRLGAFLAGAIHVRVPIGKRGLIVVSARSGDLEVEMQPGSALTGLLQPVYYRAYRATMKIDLIEFL